MTGSELLIMVFRYFYWFSLGVPNTLNNLTFSWSKY